MLRQFVVVKTEFQATHNWPTCNIEEVEFLKNEHRHRIFVTVKVETTGDREVEFFVLKGVVDQLIDDAYGFDKLKRMGSSSMETISHRLLSELRQLGYNAVEVSAFEDDEVGSVVMEDDVDAGHK
jgi:6-pyruvoyl-tetrahydropterin synthase